MIRSLELSAPPPSSRGRVGLEIEFIINHAHAMSLCTSLKYRVWRASRLVMTFTWRGHVLALREQKYLHSGSSWTFPEVLAVHLRPLAHPL